MRRKRRWLAGLVLLALVLALPLLLNLDAFRHEVHQALERQLGRRVEFASLTGRLLPRPGMLGQRVVVYEQEGFGSEPFLYAEEVTCDLALSSLWKMRLEFSHIHFGRPSINLVRHDDGAWNIGGFMMAPEPTTTTPPAPTLSATDVRLNFKRGADKEIFALVGGRFRLAPLPPGRWQLEFQGTPYRTDRRLAETGQIELRGDVGQAADFSSLPFRLQVELQQGSLAQLWAVVTGHEPPLRAGAALSARLEGTPADWTAGGALELTSLRRWDLPAPQQVPRWQVDFSLRYYGADHELEVTGLTVRSQKSQVQIAGRIVDPLGRPGVELDLRAEKLAFDDLMAQWAALKADVPERTRFEGDLQMSLSLHGPLSQWTGKLSAPQSLILQVPGLPDPVEVRGLQVALERGRVQIAPVALSFSPTHALTLEGELAPDRTTLPYRLKWTSEAVRLDALRRTAASFGWSPFGPSRWQGEAAVSLEWRGQLLGDEPARWEGEVTVREAKFQSPELNSALELPQVRVVWKGPGVRVDPLVAQIGPGTVSAALERRSRLGRWNVSVQAASFDLQTLDHLLNPRRQSLIQRLVSTQPHSEPRWRALSAAGRVRIGELTAGPFRLQQVEAEADLQSGWLELTHLRFQTYKGRFDGRLQCDFHESPPHYRLAGNVKDVDVATLLADTTRLADLFSGSLGADITLETEGINSRQLLRDLQGRVVGVLQDGSIVHMNLFHSLAEAAGARVDPEEKAQPTSLQSLAGEFRLAGEQVHLDGARLITSRTALELSGTVGFNGRLDLRVEGEPLRVAGRQPSSVAREALSYSYRLTGTLQKPQLTLVEPVPGAAAQQ